MFIGFNNNVNGTCADVTPFQVGFGGGGSTPHCYTPCPHSISLVEGYNTGYAYWDATTGEWTFGAVSGGITSLNTLTAAAQTLVVGTSGADFNINSAVSTHTFNLPTASAVNRGALSSADWSTFNSKESALTFSQPLVRTANTIKLGTLNSFGAANQLLSTNTSATDIEYRTLTLGTSGTDLSLSYGAGSITLNVPTASAANRGALSAADWTTFNAKIGGSGTNGYAAFFTAASTISSDSNFQWDNVNKRLGIGTAPSHNTDILWTPANATLTGRALNVSINNTSLSGAATNYAGYFNNTAGSGGADVRYGIYSQTLSTAGLSGTGTLYGLFGYVQGQNTGYGVYGQAHGNSNSSRTHYGVYGTTGNYNASSTTAAGGYFRATTSGSTTATSVSALVANLAYAPDTTSTSKDFIFIGQANSVNAFLIWGTGRVSYGNFFATAYAHFQAGTTSASSQPIKLTTGSLLTTEEVGVFEYVTPTLYFTNGGGKRQEIPQIQQSRVSTQFDKTDTTLANVTGLTATLVAGKTYHFEAELFIDADVTGGSKYAIAGTCTATAIKYQIQLFDNSTNTLTINARQTALAGSSGQASTTAGFVKITGMITVNAAGTLTVQFAQNAANGTSSVLTLSSFKTREIA